jgi:hypothetical protein
MSKNRRVQGDMFDIPFRQYGCFYGDAAEHA